MRSHTPSVLLGFILSTTLGVPTSANASPQPMNPARLLRCTLGHALNLDPSKDQRADEIRYEGRYTFSIRLSPTPVRQAPRPDETITFDQVDAATRVVADPSGLRRGVPDGFDHVIDLWPERVEMTQVSLMPLVSRGERRRSNFSPSYL